MSSVAETPLLEVRNLSVGFDDETGMRFGVRNASFAIRRGETFALVGESGCGKSMTSLAILRLLPEAGRIVGGEVRLEGQDLLRLPEHEMRRIRGGRIGIIFQEPSTSLNPIMRVGDQIIETIRTHTGLRGSAARAKAIEWLDRVGIPEPQRRIDDYPFQLSGGQKQRVMIAIALAAEPDLLIADEPTTALDVTIQAQVLDLLVELQKELGMAVLLITHDLAVVRNIAHHVALMYGGEIVETAPAGDFFTRPRHPYARLLFDAIPSFDKRGRPLAGISSAELFATLRGTAIAPERDLPVDVVPMIGPGWAPFGLVQETTLAGEVVGTDVGDDGHAARAGFEAGRSGAAPGEGSGSIGPVTTLPAGFGHALPARGRAPDDGQVVLEVRDLKVHYPIRKGLLRRVVGLVKAVDGVDFTLRRGRTLALLGESGCGKTTSGKALLRLLDHNAHISGSARLQGSDILHASASELKKLRQRIQIVFQDPFASLDPRMRVGETLEEGMLALRPEFTRAERQRRITNLLERVGLPADSANRHPHEFSGGQRQRIAIARALAVSPEILILDEPTSALDVSVQAQILNLLRELQDEFGMAYLFITHNFSVVEYIADDIAIMDAGRIVEAGTAEKLLVQPEHAITQRLLNAVPRLPASVTDGAGIGAAMRR